MIHPKFERNFHGFHQLLEKIHIPSRVVFIFMGVISTLWFLFRIIPKPQRAGYPCMKAAFPFMSAFIVWIMTVTGSIAAFRNARKNLKAQKYLVGSTFLIAAFIFGAYSFVHYNRKAEAAENYVDNNFFAPNSPMGEGKGIHPGRVVWVHNPDATNENGGESKTDPFFLEVNNDQQVIQNMLDEAILKLSGEKNLANAWTSIFRNFNQEKHGLKQEYQAGQTIFIKINEGTSSWAADEELKPRSWYVPSAESTPFTVHALLHHLVNIAGVPQSNIYVGDPRSHVWKSTYDYLIRNFPNVHFVDKTPSAQYTRTLITETPEPVIFYSDKGKVMKEAVSDKLFIEMAEADYLISLAALKAHARAGITLTTKNHFGSHARPDAVHLHPSLVAPDDDKPINIGEYPTVGYGRYRVLVDIMGHEMLGGNTLLFFIDGLWGGPEATQPPGKFISAPFNNDWSSSILISLDQVALESVCFDILRYEYNDPADFKKYRPHMFGADDHLQQAADPANWPEGIIYDPEDDGTPLGSLGVHEHWNNFLSKQYSRNLGIPNGIELLTVPEDLSPHFPFVARKVETAPAIDGDGSDSQWTDSPWYPINQTWIPYGAEIPEEDFKGEFKVIWSESENALHYLVKIQDDVFVDGYVYPETGYPNFDIVEVFIDEDRSGGLHIFNTGTSDAENAFSYHIAVNAPADEEVTNTMVAADIAGTSWSNRITPDYASHFPAFAMKKSGNEYIYEFSLGVYADTYDPLNQEASRINLQTGKIMGMSVAYCDNDTPNTERDNFFGSVWVTETAYNDHWQLADDYGKLALGDMAGNVPEEIYENHSPVIQSTPSDYQIKALEQDETVVPDYKVLFMDEDGDELVYTLKTSSELVHASFSEDQIKVRAGTGFSGTAVITLTASDGIDEVSVSFNVSFSNVAISLNALKDNLKIYPNPVADGTLNVGFTHPSQGIVSMKILNSDGQVIKRFAEFKYSGTFNSQLALHEIVKGFYILEIQFDNNSATIRFTK